MTNNLKKLYISWTEYTIPDTTYSAWTWISISNWTITNTWIVSTEVSDTAYASSWNGVTTIAPSKNAIYDKIYTMDSAISWKMPWFSINISHATAWNPREVKFITIDYWNMTLYGATYFKLSASSCHPDWNWYQYLEDIIIWCTYQAVVSCKVLKSVQWANSPTYLSWYDNWKRYFWDVFYVVDTDAKKVYFYILWWQYTSSDFTPIVKIWSTSLSNVTQHSWTWVYYDNTWTKVWAEWCWTIYALKDEIPTKTSQLTNDSWFITNSYHDSTKQNSLTAWNNISITSDTISSDSTSFLTQTEYNNLPASKSSDNKTYFICETIS